MLSPQTAFFFIFQDFPINRVALYVKKRIDVKPKQMKIERVYKLISIQSHKAKAQVYCRKLYELIQFAWFYDRKLWAQICYLKVDKSLKNRKTPGGAFGRSDRGDHSVQAKRNRCVDLQLTQKTPLSVGFTTARPQFKRRHWVGEQSSRWNHKLQFV